MHNFMHVLADLACVEQVTEAKSKNVNYVRTYICKTGFLIFSQIIDSNAARYKSDTELC